MLLFSIGTFGQVSVSDTLPIIIYYNDTSCKFNCSVESIYNSDCMKTTRGYIVLWKYYKEVLWEDKCPLPKFINYWFYKRE